MTDRLHAQLPRAVRRAFVGLGAAVLCGLAAPSPPAAVAAAEPADVALQVSFHTGATVRLRGQRFVARDRAAGDAVDDVLARHDVDLVERVFDAPEASLDAERRRLLAKGERGVPDLNRHYRIFAADRTDRDRLLTDLRSLAVVDEVMPEPEPVPPPVTPDFAAEQRYRLADPIGIGTGSAAGLAGGLGQNVKVIDVEYSWNQAHEDLAKAAPAGALIPNGTPQDPFGDSNHGTAVLGELISTVNAFGVSGLASGSDIGMVNAANTVYDLPDAVEVARTNLTAGDVILIEQQFPGVAGSGTPGLGDYVASEYWDPVYDVIRLATQQGIIVVEAAGNGGVDTNGAQYPQPFPKGKADSGAIIVGAGTGEPRSPCGGTRNARMSFSTYGSRVDLQGWGQCVTTTGYGSRYNADGANALYSTDFGGTSSASPIVTAAAALYSSVFQAVTGGRAPTSQAVRKRLVDTGTAQAASPAGHIGPLPNVAAATTNFDFTPPTMAVTGVSGPTSNTTPTFAFSPSEGASAVECRLVGPATTPPFAPCASPYTPSPLPDGAYTFEVKATDVALNPGEPTVRAFTVDTIAPTASIVPGSSVRGPTPTFAFSAGESAVAFACRAGTPLVPGAFTACVSPYTTAALAEGAAVFSVQATDGAGNTGPVVSRTFTVDATAPTVSITGGPSGTTSTATPQFTFSSSEAGATFMCGAGAAPAGGAFAACSSPHTTAALADGASVFEVQATDAVGNTGPVASREFTVAVAAPAAPPVAPVVAPPPPSPLPPPPAVLPPTIGPGTRLTVSVGPTGSVRLRRPVITCPALPPSCTVTARANRVGGANQRLATSTSTIAPAKTGTIRLVLTRSARALLRRRGQLKASVGMTARHGGRTATRTVQVTLKRLR